MAAKYRGFADVFSTQRLAQLLRKDTANSYRRWRLKCGVRIVLSRTDFLNCSGTLADVKRK
jgi:hypothetical protein